MADRIFIGRVEKKQTQYGILTKISMNTTDIEKLQSNLSERGWINLVMKEKDGKSWIEVDTWKPNQTSTPSTPTGYSSGETSIGDRGATTTTSSKDDIDLPF